MVELKFFLSLLSHFHVKNVNFNNIWQMWRQWCLCCHICGEFSNVGHPCSRRKPIIKLELLLPTSLHKVVCNFKGITTTCLWMIKGLAVMCNEHTVFEKNLYRYLFHCFILCLKRVAFPSKVVNFLIVLWLLRDQPIIF